MSKVMRKEARHMQRRDGASGVPLEILEHLPPKPESAYFLLCEGTRRVGGLLGVAGRLSGTVSPFTPSQGRWDPDSLRPALSLGGQASAWEGSPGALFA